VRKFKALFIDLDDTLLPEWDIAFPLWDEVCAAAALATGLDAATLSNSLRSVSQAVVDRSRFGDSARVNGYEGLALLWDHLDYNGPPLTGLSPWLPEFRHTVWIETLDSLGVKDASHAAAFAHRMWELGCERRIPYPDAFPVLQYLSEKHTLVAITNGVSGVQARKIESFGFTGYFDHIVLCGDHLPKPDPLPFRVAMQLAGARPEESAMIGNSLKRDIAGARNAGIFSVWVNRNGEKAGDEVRPDVEIQCLEDLRKIF
jgi:putative hydrolase of the HAD superfamily